MHVLLIKASTPILGMHLGPDGNGWVGMASGTNSGLFGILSLVESVWSGLFGELSLGSIFTSGMAFVVHAR